MSWQNIAHHLNVWLSGRAFQFLSAQTQGHGQRQETSEGLAQKHHLLMSLSVRFPYQLYTLTLE